MRKRRVIKIKCAILRLCCIIGLMTVCAIVISKATELKAVQYDEEKTNQADEKAKKTDLQDAVSKMNSEQMVLIDLETKEILISKDKNQKIYPASMTKIMTALVCIEQMEDLEDYVYLSEASISKLYVANAWMTGFRAGEGVRAIDLLYALLLDSGADAAVALAECIAGTEAEFAELMNRKAAELGLKNTNFVNATGLHDNNHYTTVGEQAVILQKALETDIFRTVFSSDSHFISSTTYRSDGMRISSTLTTKLEEAGKSLNNGCFIGGKTGTTDEAGLCLASAAMINGKQYLLVTAGAEYVKGGQAYHVIDAVDIYNSLI